MVALILFYDEHNCFWKKKKTKKNALRVSFSKCDYSPIEAHY